MNSNNKESATMLAESYAAYLKVDNQKEMHVLDESIEDTLTRLEELESGIKMLQAEREKFGTCDFTAARCNLNTLCQRIHKLDEMSKRVLQDVESLESVVDGAEANLINSTEGKLKNILKPLLFMRSDAGSSTTGPSIVPFTPPTVFKTTSFFPKQDGKDDLPDSTSVESST